MPLYKDEYGVRIRITIVDRGGLPVDLTGGSSRYLVQKPSGATATWSSSIIDAANGVTEYIIQSGDLDESGVYKINPEITFSSPNRRYYGSKVEIHVKELYS